MFVATVCSSKASEVAVSDSAEATRSGQSVHPKTALLTLRLSAEFEGRVGERAGANDRRGSGDTKCGS